MEQERIKIEPDIRKASALPARAYSDPEVFEAARERVFARSWQFIGESDRVRTPGQVSPFILLEGCPDEPLMLTRDVGDRLHCLSNVSTHRIGLALPAIF